MNQIDLVKLRFYYEHVLTQVYSEGPSPYHETITKDVVRRFVDPMQLSVESKIIDLGCGHGYFLDAMRERGFKNIIGITLSPDDIDVCKNKGHAVSSRDMNFLDQVDESIDFLFCRHSLEHSPFPYLTLLEYNRVLKPGGRLYIEVPQPDTEVPQEDNPNHYSILGRSMWLSLLKRTGFDVDWYDYEMPVQRNDASRAWTEKYYVMICTRRRSVDVK